MIYILNFLVVLLYFGLFRFLLPKRKAELLFVLTFAIHAILFRALAYPFDFVDTSNYAKAYQNIFSYDFYKAVFMKNRYTEWGRGYVAVNWLLSRVSRDYMLMFITLSVVTVGSTIWFYAKTSYSILLTVLLYLAYPTLYLMGFAVLRQHLAAAVVLIALYHIRNYKISVPLALLAPLLHASGIVLLPFFLWRKINFKRLASVEMLAFTVVAVVVMRLSIGYLMNVAGIFSGGRNASFGSQSVGTNIVPLAIIGILMVMAVACRLFNKCSGRDYEILNFMAYGFAISVFGLGLYGAGRLTLFFLYVVPVVITFFNRYSNSMRMVNNLCIALMFAITARQIYYLHSSWIKDYNYKFYWEMPRKFK